MHNGSINNADLNASTRAFYITDGTALYLVTLLQMNSAATLDGLSVYHGLPNLSPTNRIVTVNDISSGTTVDLSDAATSSTTLTYPSTTATYPASQTTATNELTTGTMRLDGWPRIVIDNVKDSAAQWMGATYWSETLEQMSLDTPHVYYYTNGNQTILTGSDDFRSIMRQSGTADAYAAGDVVASVVKFSPNGSTNAMTVTPTYAAGSAFKITQLTIADTNMTFLVSWTGDTFTDKLSGEILSNVERANQSITLPAVPSHIYGDAPFTVATTASSALPVTLIVTSGPATVSGNTMTLTGSGTVALTASQSGNASYQAAVSQSLSFVIAQAPLTATASSTTITYGTAAPTPTGTLTGIVSPDVITEAFVSNEPAIVPLPAAVYTLTPSVVGTNAASYIVTAVKGTLTVSKATPAAIALTSSSAKAVVGTSITFAAALTVSGGTPTGTITFFDGTTQLGTAVSVATGSITVSTLAIGSHAITAQYSGDANFNASTSPMLTEIISVPPAFSVAAPPTTAFTLATNQAATLSFAVSGVGGYAKTVTFSSTGAPAGVTIHFAPTSVTFAGVDATQTVIATITNTGNINSVSTLPPAFVGSRILPALFALLLPFAFRRKRAAPLPIVLAAIFLIGSMSGCGTGTPSTAQIVGPKSGTYAVTITATDGAATSTQPLSITVP